MRAVQKKYPDALIQFEDFLTPDAYALLNTYRDRVLCFNDDIQGTAAVALAGVYASTRVTEKPFRDLRIMFLGAGSAATGYCRPDGVGARQGGPERRRGPAASVVRGRERPGDQEPHRSDAAQPAVRARASAARIRRGDRCVKPHVLIGATGVAGTFTRRSSSGCARINERPVLFALSNPTSHAECTAEQAYRGVAGG